MKFLILDNGSFEIKVGYSTDAQCQYFHNSIAKKSTAAKSVSAKSFFSSNNNDCAGIKLKSPFEKGILTNFPVQKFIWDDLFSSLKTIDQKNTTLIITEPIFNLPNISKYMLEVIEEEYSFAKVIIKSGPFLSSQLYKQLTPTPPTFHIIVDSSHSQTYIIPFENSTPITKAIRKINIGGKLLTNYLKETISFRYYNMMDETVLVNHVKESLGFISADFFKDLELAKAESLDFFSVGNVKKYSRKYILPDFITERLGYVSDSQEVDPTLQVLELTNERFTIPELLFSPSYIGLTQSGIPETIVEAIKATALLPHEQEMFYANIMVTGGNTMFPGFKARLEGDLEGLVEEGVKIRIIEKGNDAAFEGAKVWVGGFEGDGVKLRSLRGN